MENNEIDYQIKNVKTSRLACRLNTIETDQIC